MYLRFRDEYHNLIMTNKECLIHYMTTWGILDIFASLPVRLATNTWGSDIGSAGVTKYRNWWVCNVRHLARLMFFPQGQSQVYTRY